MLHLSQVQSKMNELSGFKNVFTYLDSQYTTMKPLGMAPYKRRFIDNQYIYEKQKIGLSNLSPVLGNK